MATLHESEPFPGLRVTVETTAAFGRGTGAGVNDWLRRRGIRIDINELLATDAIEMLVWASMQTSADDARPERFDGEGGGS